MFRIGQTARHAYQRVGMQNATHLLQKLVVSVGRFDKYLCHSRASGHTLQFLEPGSAFISSHRKISVEGESLAIESGGHQSQQYAARADQRHDAQPLALGYGHKIGTGIGNRRTSGVAHQPYRLSLTQRFEPSAYPGTFGVRVQLMELTLVNGERRIPTPQKPAGTPQILHYETSQILHDIQISAWQDIVERCSAQLHGNQV